MRRAAALALLLGCGLPEPTEVGAHVQLAMDPGLTPCGDLVGHMDAYVEWLAGVWGVPPPSGDGIITYYWLDTEGFASRTVCVNAEGGCSLGGDVYATGAPIDHELVHALAFRFGLPPSFFIEGLAAAYQWPSEVRYVGEVTAEAVLDAFETRELGFLPSELYPLAGAFVAFVIERHGIRKFIAVYSQLRLLDGRRRVSRVFTEVFGESFEEAAAAFERDNVGGCAAEGQGIDRFECEAPALAWDGEAFGAFMTLTCEVDGAVGPFRGDQLMVVRTLEVPEDGAYEVRVVGDAIAGSAGPRNLVEVSRCGRCADFVAFSVSPESSPEVHLLPAGRYVVRMHGPVHEASGIGLSVVRQAVVEGP